ncbi:hypothetical protein AX15_006100 [Amanita polypyramis BW_CC]|nr:hypothetical protein AX15_006100 [Amanita polypyramis BW_CC]
MSLYSFYAATIVASKSTLLELSCDRLVLSWTTISIISFAIFIAQTTAWTTLFTPQPFLMPSQVMFRDGDFLKPIPGDPLANIWAQNQIETLLSGVVPAGESLNLTVSFVHNAFQVNSTTWGILPFPSPYQSPYPQWTRINAIQQGTTAEVSCKAMSKSDPAVSPFNKTLGEGYSLFTLCCNCTSDDNSGLGPPIILYTTAYRYLAFASCPYRNNTREQGITIYTYSKWEPAIKVCTLKPQILDVNVTYNYAEPNAGTITIQPLPDSRVDLDLNNTILDSFIQNLRNSFFFGQSTTSNVIMVSLLDIMDESLSSIDYGNLMDQLLADYIRGAFEFSSTLAREKLLDQYDNGTYVYDALLEKKNATQFVAAFVWGHISQSRIPTVVSPLIIMITTIIIVLCTFFRFIGRKNSEHILYFDPMDVRHVIAACGPSNVNELTLPDCGQDIIVYSEDVQIGLRKRTRQIW